MKTKLTRLTKSTLSVVLTICMLISCLMVGTITAHADAWMTMNGGGIFIYDNSSTNWSNVQIMVGRRYTYGSEGIGCKTYNMSPISDTNLYYFQINDWATSGDGRMIYDIYFVTGANGWGWENNTTPANRVQSLKNQGGNATGVYSNSAISFDKSTVYTCTGTVGGTPTIKKASSGYSDYNYNQTIGTTTGGTVSASGFKLNGNSSSTTSTLSGTTLTAAKSSTVTATATASSGYTFSGWYSASTGGTFQSSDNPYKYTVTGTKTLYARFTKEAETEPPADPTYSVVGTFVSSQWNAPGDSMDKSGSGTSATYSKSYTLAGGQSYQFDVLKDGSWDNKIYTGTITSGTSYGTLSTINDGGVNAYLTLNNSYSDYTVTIKISNNATSFTVTITGKTAAVTRYYVSGETAPIGRTSGNDAWPAVSSNHELTETSTGSGTYSKTYSTVSAGTYAFQINATTTSTWGTVYKPGNSNITSITCSGCTKVDDNNIKFTLSKTATSVTITFNPTTKTVTISAVIPDDEYYVSGAKAPIGYSGSGSNWQPNANKMTKSGTTYSYSYSSVAAGEYEFKITKDGTWDTQYGGNNIGTVTGTGGTLTSVSGTGGNAAKLTLDPSKYTTYSVVIKFDTSTSKINVEIKGLAQAEEEHFVVGKSITDSGYIGGGSWENPRPDGHKMAKSSTNSKEFSIKYTNVPADTYKFQITDGYYGTDHVAYNHSNATTVYSPSLINDEGYDNDNTNAIFTLSKKATSVIITFNTSTKTITVTVEFPEDKLYVFGEPHGESSWSNTTFYDMTKYSNTLYYYEYADVYTTVKYRIRYNDKYYATTTTTADKAVSQDSSKPDSTYMKDSASEGWSFTFNPNGARYKIWVDVSNVDKYGNGVKTWVELVRYDAEVNVTYYVDMHGNSNAPEIIVTDKSGGSILSNTKLTKVTNKIESSIYGATVKTQYLTTDNNIYIKIKSGSYESGVFTIDRGTATAANAELWFEAVNEEETSFVRRESTTKIGGVASGRTRIYLKKPSDMNEASKWNEIGVYCWRNSDESREYDWDNTPVMTYMGQDSSGYKYYYRDIKTEADRIIFQGLESVSASRQGVPQTEDLQRGQNNVYVLAKDGSTATASTSATAPSASRYTSSLTMNKGSEASIALTAGNYTGASVTYNVVSTYASYVSVDSSGKLTALKSTQQLSGKTAQVQIKIKGSFDSLLTSGNTSRDVATITVSVVIYDASQINEFSLMSTASQNTTVTASTGGVIQSIGNVVGTGFKKGTAYTASYNGTAIVTQSGNVFTIKYAKPDGNYKNLKITFETTSIPTESGSGKRYGFDHWNKNNVQENTYTAAGKANTAVADELTERKTITPNMVADGSTLTAIYVEYSYVDLHITYTYYEYVVERMVNGVKDYYYFYDPEFAGNENPSNPNFAASHTLNSYTKVVEVRATSDAGKLKPSDTSQIAELVKQNITNVSNNYYNYSLDESSISNATAISNGLKVNAHLAQTPRTYKVIVNDSKGKTKTIDEAEGGGPIYYQSYIDVTAKEITGSDGSYDWRELSVKNDANNVAVLSLPLLARGPNYRFRVTDNTTIVLEATSSENSGENPKKQSTVTYSGWEITHENNVEKLIQNFYIADFFSKDMVTKEDADGTMKVMDDVTFVGGGIIYYSVDDEGTPLKSSVVNSGYVSEDGVAVEGEIKDVIRSAIENNSKTAEYTGSTDRTKVAYSTEIGAQVYKDELGNSTGLVLRYLPYEILNYSDGSYAKQDQAYRYSNALGAYQYVYSAKAENKKSNEGKNMRLYSFYIYSYTDYDEDDKAVTVYDVVLSDNYADAETYRPNATN